MGRKRTITPELERDICAAFHKSKGTLESLSSEFGFSTGGIQRILQRNGHTPLQRRCAPKPSAEQDVRARSPAPITLARLSFEQAA